MSHIEEVRYSYPLADLIRPYTEYYKNADSLLLRGFKEDVRAIPQAERFPGRVLGEIAKGHWRIFSNPLNVVARLLVIPECVPYLGTIDQFQDDKRLLLYQAAETELSREKKRWATVYFGRALPLNEDVSWWDLDEDTMLEKIDSLTRFQQEVTERSRTDRALQ